MSGYWFPTAFLGAGVASFFTGFLLGGIFALVRTVFFSGNGD